MPPTRSLFWNEIHGDRVDTVAGVFTGKSLSKKNVAQVAVTVGTENLSSLPVGVRLPANGSRNFVVKTWPAAVAVEFVL